MRLFGGSKNVKKLPGKLIVLDGIDGSGTTTQLQLLSEALTFAGFTVTVVEFPNAGSIARGLIEKYSTKSIGIAPQAEALFYATDRFEAKMVLEKLLHEGNIVLTSGYVSQTAAAEGVKLPSPRERVSFFRWLYNLEYEIFKIPQPHLSVILDMPAEKAQLLKTERGGRGMTKREELEILQTESEVYKQFATLFPKTKLVSCTFKDTLLTPQEIHNAVWQLVRRIALGRSNTKEK